MNAARLAGTRRHECAETHAASAMLMRGELQISEAVATGTGVARCNRVAQATLYLTSVFFGSTTETNLDASPP